MLAYKYKTCEPFQYILDILLNERLYCASIEQFNDPLEGLLLFNPYDYAKENSAPLSREIDAAKQLAAHRENIKEYRICSLSRCNDDILLWSHYCGGHTGLCIEIDLPDAAVSVHKVVYVDNPKEHEAASRYMPMHYLTYKLRPWQNEQEIRIIQRERYYDVRARIRRVILGSRIPDEYFTTIENISKGKCSLAMAYIDRDKARMKMRDLALR